MNSEYYVIAIAKVDEKMKGLQAIFGGVEKFYVIIKDRKELSELYSLMPVDKYKVEGITALNETKSFEQFKKELTTGEDNKPKGLNFGDTE